MRPFKKSSGFLLQTKNRVKINVFFKGVILCDQKKWRTPKTEKKKECQMHEVVKLRRYQGLRNPRNGCL